jgi:HlyD family type I secretion membrane fusion protein
VAALVVIAVFFGGLGSWAALAPLDSAALASARVTVAGNRKTVQHLEGGIVGELRVREGDRVAPGQLLLALDDTQARATLDQLRARYDNLLAREARLLAERSGGAAAIIRFPPLLRERADDPHVANAIAGERSIFEARQAFLMGRERILKQRVVQLKKEIEGLQAQVAAETTQLRLVRDEQDAIETLFEKGMVDKPRLLAAQRAEAQLEGSRGEHSALIARAEQRIGEAELEIIDLSNRFLNEVVQDLAETQADLTDLSQRLKAAEDVLARTEVRAPVGGTIVGLEVHTVGGVVAPGQTILDIVPLEERLELEVQVDPNDIDVVHVGLAAQVMLTAYNQRTTPTLDGRVTRVSADSFSDPRSGRTYFLARVAVEPAERDRVQGVDLYPGMPAEVFIPTGRRTALDYLLAPITQSLGRAFRES